MPKTAEAALHQQVCEYLKWQHPDVLYRTDLGGIRLSMSQAINVKRTQQGRAWPDIFIAEPRHNTSGLFLELKKVGTVLYLKNGTFTKDVHLNEQREVLEALEQRGYRASFAVGLDHALQLITHHLKGV